MKSIPDIIHDFNKNHTKYSINKTTIYSPAPAKKEDKNEDKPDNGGYPWSDYEGEEGYVSWSVGDKIEKGKDKEVKSEDKKPILFRPRFEEFDPVRAYHQELGITVEAIVLKVNDLGNSQYSYDLETYYDFRNGKQGPTRFTTFYCFPIIN